MAAPLSRESVVANAAGLTVLGGITPAGSSLATVSTITRPPGRWRRPARSPTRCTTRPRPPSGGPTFVFGGGSPDTLPPSSRSPRRPSRRPRPRAATVAGQLPQPRSDLAAATVPAPGGQAATTYLVGGYDGTTYLPGVLATTDGTHFTHGGAPCPSRSATRQWWPLAGMLFAFGGQIRSPPGPTATATDGIQMIDPATHRATVVGHLPQALYGAVRLPHRRHHLRGRRTVPGGPTLTPIRPSSRPPARCSTPGSCPRPTPSAGYATVGSGHGAVGYLVGGEVASQAGPDQAGVASGSLRSVISLRPSRYGGPAGIPAFGLALRRARCSSPIAATTAWWLSTRPATWSGSTRRPPCRLRPGASTSPTTPSSCGAGRGSSPTRRTTTPSSRSATRRARSSGSTVTPAYPGAGPGYLNQPDDAYLLKSGVITVADASNNRILFISPQGQVINQIGNGADAHNPPTSIAYPNGDTPLANGNVLVSEINGSWVDEYTPAGTLVWTVHMTDGQLPLRPPTARHRPVPDDRLRPAGRGTHPRVHPTGPGHLDLRRPFRRRRAQEAVAGRTATRMG